MRLAVGYHIERGLDGARSHRRRWTTRGSRFRARFSSNSSRMRARYNQLLADRVHRPYPAADVNDPDAVLTVRDWPGGPRTTIPRDQWRFARGGMEPTADDTHLWLGTEFKPGKVYEVVYRTRRCPVVGAGLLAVRDCAAFLRTSDATDNPCAGRIDRAYAFGMSQSGRFLRHFLYHRPQCGRGGQAGLRWHQRPCRGGAAGRVQPPLRPALAAAHPQFRPPDALRG